MSNVDLPIPSQPADTSLSFRRTNDTYLDYKRDRRDDLEGLRRSRRISDNGRRERRGGDSFEGFIKVPNTDTAGTHFAAMLAWNARRDNHQPMLATGAGPINRAIDSIIKARRFLEKDDLDLFAMPAFRDEDMGDSLAVFFESREIAPDQAEGEHRPQIELTVSKMSKPRVVAGYICARAREGKPVIISAIGEDSIANAMIATAYARLFLDEDGIDIKLLIGKEEVHKENLDHPLFAVSIHVVLK